MTIEATEIINKAFLFMELVMLRGGRFCLKA